MFEIAGGIILAVVVLFVLGIILIRWTNSAHPKRNLLIFLAIVYGLIVLAANAFH